MLSKVYSGHSFYHACRYVVNKLGAEVLAYEGVRVHDHKVLSDDFIRQQQLRPQKEKACFHCSLSFYPGEKLSDELMAKIGKEYLEKLGIVNTQYAITKHTDRRHLHLHILANLVNNEGKTITDSYLGLKGKKTTQQLTREYRLIPALEKNLQLTNREALRESEAVRYTIYAAVKEALPHCRTTEELAYRLRQQGIETLFKYRGQTKEKQGMSFKLGELSFKGSKIDRQFSLGNLEKKLVLNQQQSLTKDEKNTRQLSQNNNEAAGNNIIGTTEKLADLLLKPGETTLSPAQELLREQQQKKKRKQSLRL